ncbi:hypothetical protein M3172_16080 [Mesobacillus subterraneus]|uniref:hypothetical protein n=1 Tax=Mesobacillus subterraneus TaxID=285983 RepID=UPI0020422650|nr:hypothetical protein [Mesobacillus subterraneus]MCM3574716.1 hypothetical protein [Mesobacillus subterraneus]
MFTHSLPGVLKSLDKGYYLRSIEEKGFEVKNLPTNLDEVLNHYRKCLRETFNKNVYLVKGETFTQEFVLDDEFSYNISWDISTAKELIKENKIKASTFDVGELFEQVKKKDIDNEYLTKAIR